MSLTEATKHLSDWTFDEAVILAVPVMVYESTKYEGRGGSIFDGKLDSFDAFDEAWSQWMDALRGRPGQDLHSGVLHSKRSGDRYADEAQPLR